MKQVAIGTPPAMTMRLQLLLWVLVGPAPLLNAAKSQIDHGDDRNLRRLAEFAPQGFGASQRARHVMNSLSARDALLTVLTMSSAFLLEVAVFAWIGMF